MGKQFKKVHGSKNQFGELSIDDLDEGFGGNERTALSYLEKFGDEIDDIKTRIQNTLVVDGINYNT